MLALDDPLWEKLDTCRQDRNVPKLLSGLGEKWNNETADSLLWDCLTHQESLYGATYAAVPYLLRIAQPESNKRQRDTIASFRGIVVLNAFYRRRSFGRLPQYEPLQGLPGTLDGWERKRDVFRSLVASYEKDRFVSHYELTLLHHFGKFLETGPVNARDLEKIDAIRMEFVSSLPAIRIVCERSFLENLSDIGGVGYRLRNIVAADCLFSLAHLLADAGDSGRIRCSSCGWVYEFGAFEDLLGSRWAIYANERKDRIAYSSSAMRDFREGRPDRADGFIDAASLDTVFEPLTSALLALAARVPNPRPTLMLRHLLGTFCCCKCGMRGPVLPPGGCHIDPSFEEVCLHPVES
jgi:hypothetical protein